MADLCLVCCRWLQFTHVEQLPKLELPELKSLTFHRGTQAESVVLDLDLNAKLAMCPALTMIDVMPTLRAVHVAALKFENWPKLKSVSFGNTVINEAAIAAMAENCRQIDTLGIAVSNEYVATPGTYLPIFIYFVLSAMLTSEDNDNRLVCEVM
jgi:hypothetical protein